MLFKKKLKHFISLMLCLFFTFSMTGCFLKSDDELFDKRMQEIIATFEKDDTFYYALDELTDTYHLCARTKPRPSDFYTPLQFNGKDVSQLHHIVFFGVDGLFETSFSGMFSLKGEHVGGEIDNLYFTNNINISLNSSNRKTVIAKNQYFPHVQTNADAIQYIKETFISRANNIYVTAQVFEVISNTYKDSVHKSHYQIIVTQKDVSYFLQKANVTFYYNNNSAKNKIFLVDNKDGAFLINKPQYDPILKGYEFAGWYKEPECINKWNFETDKTPELQYDENNELIFVETKLYAKWI